ncbi:hypothetical protein [Streptomyces sp. NPDC003299]
MGMWISQQEGAAPHWYDEIDPLDALFSGTVFPRTFRDEFEFANSRDAWLRLLHGTVHGKGIQRFVREAVTASEELGRPVNDGRLMVALVGRLEEAGLDRRPLPRRLQPEVGLLGCRAVYGPSSDLKLPKPPPRVKSLVKRFWRDVDGTSWGDTPHDILREGLRRFEAAGLPVKDESALLLPALYAALMAKPGELIEESGAHAVAWALGMDDRSSLIPVLDLLLIAPDVEMSVADALGRLFAVPAFTEPIPTEALLWTSSPGLALPRVAFEMAIPEVSTHGSTLTPDMLDWAGMHARMRLSSAARDGDMDVEESEVEVGTQEEPNGQWTKRREAVRDAVRQKVRKKSDSVARMSDPLDSPVERLWNADGSSVVRFSADSPHGETLSNSIQAQRHAFRQKFGRDPGPGDPLFFDPDADEPSRLTKAYFDNMLLDMAERVAERGIDPAYLHACREVGYLVTEDNKKMFTMAEVLAFSRAVQRHQRAGK